MDNAGEKEVLVKNKKNPKTKKLVDISCNLFDYIINNIKIKNYNNEWVTINGFKDFYDFQKNINHNYKSSIPSFNYRKLKNISVIKNFPYEATKLIQINEKDSEIIIAPNKIFAKTLKLENKIESSLSHYINIIGNSLLVDGISYFEVKILSLGEDTDLFLGIISNNSVLFSKNEYKNISISQFEDGYSIDLNNHYELQKNKIKYLVKEGDIITILVDLIKYKIHFFINGEKIKNIILIEQKNCGYYPAFSLSSDKEIQVNFGGDYKLKYNSNEGNRIDIKPISKLNNLASIISYYMSIIKSENDKIKINKIINHPQITNNESLRLFYPMLQFFGNYVFRDEYIIKKYILKFFYEDYKNENDKDIYEFFDKKIKFLKLIIQTIDLSKKKKAILFLLNRLAEQIKHYSYKEKKFEIWCNLIKLYNYFLKNKFIQQILFENNDDNIGVNNTHNEIKKQLYLIFQPIKIFDLYYPHHESDDFSNITDKINDFLKNEYYRVIDNKSLIQPFSELIDTLLAPVLKNQKDNSEDIHELINNNYSKSITFNDKDIKYDNFDILIKYLSLDKDNMKDDKINNKRSIQNNHYRIIWLDLIRDMYYSNSNEDKYNLLSTILVPLLFIFNKLYEKEITINIQDNQILSFLPTIGNYDFLSRLSSKIFLSDESINNDFIKTKIYYYKFYFELYTKKYVISSYVLKIIINLFSFFDDDLYSYFNLENIIENSKLEFKKNEENINYNKYIYKFQKLLLLLSDEYFKIIDKTINIIVPYLNELLENNFFLFLPINIINGIKFFVLYVFKYISINKKANFISKKNIVNLINNYIKLNFELFSSTVEVDYRVDALHNIAEFLVLIENIQEISTINLIIEKNDNNTQNKTIDDILQKFVDFQLLFALILKNYKESNDISLKKNIEKFMIFFSSKYNTEFSDFFTSRFLENISEIKKDSFFEIFVIEACAKRRLIENILKITEILNKINENEIISKNILEKLVKYFQTVLMCLSSLMNYITRGIVIKRYFNKFIQIPEQNEEDMQLKIESDENGKYPIYYYLILDVSLIIKKLMKEKLFILFKKANDENFIQILFKFIRKNIIFAEKVIIKISNMTNENKEYLRNIFFNIKKNDIADIICLLEKYDDHIPYDYDKILSLLKGVISFLNHIEKKYNIKVINSQEQREIAKTCPICLDNYSDCHVSPCGHMFCLTCIKKLKDLRCPICRDQMNSIIEYPNFKLQQHIMKNSASQDVVNNRDNQQIRASYYISNNRNNQRISVQPIIIRNNQQNSVSQNVINNRNNQQDDASQSVYIGRNNMIDNNRRSALIEWISSTHPDFIRRFPHIQLLDYNSIVRLFNSYM